MTNKLALVVDDSRVARMMLCKLLQSSGFEVVEQGSADDALAWLQTTQQSPLIIFMDLMMPGMDGLTATRQIKNDLRWQAIPVVLCTSNDSEADKLSAHDSGVLALLSKPPEARQLQMILNDLRTPAITGEAEQSVVPEPAADISAALTMDEVMAQLEQQVLPSWLQQSQDSAEQISQQIAENIVRQLIDERLNGLSGHPGHANADRTVRKSRRCCRNSHAKPESVQSLATTGGFSDRALADPSAAGSSATIDDRIATGN